MDAMVLTPEVIAEAMASLTPEERGRLLNAEELVDFIKRKIGFPLKLSSFRKLKSQGRGPTPAARWGRQDFYQPQVGIDWVVALASGPLGIRDSIDECEPGDAA